MTATLALNRNGTGWSVGDERSYAVWGGVRSGAATGGPKGRYVANPGHVQDDESGLIYMRARYYEPESGRFVSEDPEMDGVNFFVYCKNSPTAYVDFDGKISKLPWVVFGLSLLKEIGKSLGDGGEFNFAKVIVKGAQGYVIGLVSSWALKLIVFIWQEAVAGCFALNGTSMGLASAAILSVTAYATLLILLLDCAFIMGTEMLVDKLFPE